MGSLCSECGSEVSAGKACPVCLLQWMSKNGTLAVPDTARESIPQSVLEQEFPQLSLIAPIGCGGMGTVYRARQKTLDRDIALKVIRKEISEDPLFLERFKREAKLLARLSHPNIVTVFDFGQTVTGRAFLTMEYVEGINLREVIGARSLSIPECLTVILGVAKALDYAHDRGVIHRDIKPENILLDDSGYPKLADFGIAKLVEGTVDGTLLTATREVLGSPAYLAPEWFESRESIDPRADLYALGIVFYELLTGRLPLGRFEPPSQIAEHGDARLDPIVLRLLERDPKRRTASAKELIEELEAFQRQIDLPELVPIEGLESTTVPFECRNDHGVVAVGLARGNSSQLELEYRTYNWIGKLSENPKTLILPRAKMTGLTLLSNPFGTVMKVSVDSLFLLGNLPGAERGILQLKIHRNDVDLATRIVQRLGFPSVRQEIQRRKALSATDITLGVLMIFCGWLNSAAIAILEYSISNLVDTTTLVILAITIPVVLTPLILTQWIAGAMFLSHRNGPVLQAASVVSLLPVTPIWFFSFPLGIYGLAYLWSEAANTSRPSRIRKEVENLGRTTWMLLKESRTARMISVVNVLAMALVLFAVFAYRSGWYPSVARFRVVDSSVNWKLMEESVLARLRHRFPSAKVDSSHQPYLEVQSWRCQQTQIQSQLAIRSRVEIVFLQPSSESGNAAEGREATLSRGLVPFGNPNAEWGSSDFASAKEEGLTSSRSRHVTLYRESMVIEPQGVTRVVSHLGRIPNAKDTLTIEWSEAGRRQMREFEKTGIGTSAELGLLANGIVIGLAPPNAWDAEQVEFQLGDRSLIASGLEAAIRGPELLSELEPVSSH